MARNQAIETNREGAEIYYGDEICKSVSYGAEITAFVENRRMKKLTGVKSKEILIWVTISEIYIDESDLGKITFKTPSGIGRSFPVDAFELEEEVKKEDEKVVKK
ncbi:hypothetical protein IFM89_015171 [Coptis chinensis]|uniref:Uncharacterized protein n=1 Tax=Coptis chinensis TaxID=261450 RepID=A0A835GWK3_9MAGN|nr:hypothetical protein IFM89_015171 [Coptis chinensis]